MSDPLILLRRFKRPLTTPLKVYAIIQCKTISDTLTERVNYEVHMQAYVVLMWYKVTAS